LDAQREVRVKICVHCGEPFTYFIGRGADKKYCSKACYKLAHKQLSAQRLKSFPQCANPECSNKATRVGRGLCETCYYRLRRTGSYKKKQVAGWRKDPRGYIILYNKEHPLSSKAGLVYQHREVAYNHYGDGEQVCFWCGKQLTWKNVVIDHLNENKSDNRIDNLALSCNACNRSRGRMIPFIDSLKTGSVYVLLNLILKRRFGNLAIEEKTHFVP